MANLTFKGIPIRSIGNLPAVGSTAPAFKLTRGDLSDVGLDAFEGKKKILNIVMSLDTRVCANSAIRFNKEAVAVPDTVILNISADLPFAQKRFCESAQVANVVMLSTMRSPAFGKDYGVVITDGAVAGLMSRSVLVLDRNNKVVYSEHVAEGAAEPNYDAALAALKKI